LHKNTSAECISSRRVLSRWRFTRVGASINLYHYEELIASHARGIDKSRAQCVTRQLRGRARPQEHLPGVPRDSPPAVSKGAPFGALTVPVIGCRQVESAQERSSVSEERPQHHWAQHRRPHPANSGNRSRLDARGLGNWESISRESRGTGELPRHVRRTVSFAAIGKTRLLAFTCYDSADPGRSCVTPPGYTAVLSKP